MTDIELIESTKIRMIAAECALRHLTGSAASVIPISGTKRVIAAGTREEIARLLGIGGAAGAVAAEVPAGWQIVPVEPTDEMREQCKVLNYADDIDGEWARMLAAAPTPPAPATVAAELTDEQIIDIRNMVGERYNSAAHVSSGGAIEFAREILKAAGSAARDQALTNVWDDALDAISADVREMQNNLETFGPYAQETARVALDGVLDAIDELRTAPSEAGKGGSDAD